MRIVVQEGFGFGGIVYCVLYTQQMIPELLSYIAVALLRELIFFTFVDIIVLHIIVIIVL